jgi:hypothetical protein
MGRFGMLVLASKVKRAGNTSMQAAIACAVAKCAW